MNLTPRERRVLTTYHGGTVEYQDIQARLSAIGRRWCPACQSVLPTTSFTRNKRLTLGLASRCRTCKRRPRHFVKLTDATRLARFYKRSPTKRPTPKRGPYKKTLDRRARGDYINDPLQPDLWLAGSKE